MRIVYDFFKKPAYKILRDILLFCLILAEFCIAGPLLEKANGLYNTGKYIEAIKVYKDAAVGGDNPALCYYNAANAFFQMDSIPQALVYYRATVNYAPEFYKGYLNLAIAYYYLNDFGNCISTMRHGLDIEPQDKKGCLILAAAYRKVRSFGKSIAIFEDLAGRNPDMEESFIALGEMYRDLDDAEMAKKWLLSYPVSGKNHLYANILLADLFESTDDYSRTIYYLEQAFSLDKTKKWTLYRLVMLYRKMGNDLVALETAVDGMASFPDFPDLALEAGNIAYTKGDYFQAQQYYTTAANLGSANAVIGLENVRNQLKEQADASQ